MRGVTDTRRMCTCACDLSTQRGWDDAHVLCCACSICEVEIELNKLQRKPSSSRSPHDYERIEELDTEAARLRGLVKEALASSRGSTPVRRVPSSQRMIPTFGSVSPAAAVPQSVAHMPNGVGDGAVGQGVVVSPPMVVSPPSEMESTATIRARLSEVSTAVCGECGMRGEDGVLTCEE